RSAPSGVVYMHIADLIPYAEVTAVVHCAGRTRSIVGARLLQRMGFSKVFDLRNGTMGWLMAGLELETGPTRLALPEVSAAGLTKAAALAARSAADGGVRRLAVP